ncbi:MULTISPECIES: helix-turn-helix domain-containing protein [Vibrio]|uniref:helix-turn-helix domain-containing protein n=1 Tax=Vibrio TaxID=662 RepID=UPI0001B93B77|nr:MULTISPECIES: AraC family transcriptional regulator [Vibrio]EEX34394.1 transcriptional regulator [Vibrio coralliilyticus ATCC BAA-450]MDE3898439.1 AraC family transcriptional regulator [Vibrio sp. CC007]
MIEKSSELAKHLSQSEAEYLCVPLTEYLGATTLPTPICKQQDVLILLIERGKLSVSIDHQDAILIEGELLIVQPNKPHSIIFASDDISGMAYLIKGDGLIGAMGDHSLIFSLEILSTWSESKYTLTRDFAEFIKNIFTRIYYEYAQPHSNSILVNAYTITLLLELESIHDMNNDRKVSAVDIVRRYKKDIANTINQKYSASDYALRLSMTPNHLNKSVKSVTGLSASQLLHRMKITEAKYLLYRADLSIETIGVQLGFEDLSYFSRFFKKQEGMTPSEFRKKQFSNKPT